MSGAAKLSTCGVLVVLAASLCLPTLAQGRDTDEPAGRFERPLRPERGGNDDTRNGEEREGRPGDSRGERFRMQTYTAEQVDEIIAVLEDVDADAARRLTAVRQRDPQRKTYSLPSRFVEGYRRLVELRESDPQQYEVQRKDTLLERMTRHLAGRIRYMERHDPEAAEKLRSELRSKLVEHFQVRQQIHADRLERLEQRLRSLREDLESRQKNRETLIAEQVDAMRRDPGAAQPMSGWTTPPQPDREREDDREGTRGNAVERGGDRVESHGPPPHGHAGGRPDEASALNVDEALKVIEDFDPALAKRMRQVSDPEALHSTLRPYLSWLRRMQYVKAQAPALYQLYSRDYYLSVRARELAVAMEDKTPAEADLRKLRGLVSDHFDVREGIRQHHLSRFTEELDRMRQDLAIRKERQSDMVNARMNELAGTSGLPPW